MDLIWMGSLLKCQLPFHTAVAIAVYSLSQAVFSLFFCGWSNHPSQQSRDHIRMVDIVLLCSEYHRIYPTP